MSLPIPVEILRLANATWETRGNAKPRSYREPLIADGQVVGFISPHETRWGWRLGPIFVLPTYRRRGLVADDNPASSALHARAGFTRWKRGNGGWFMRREARV